MGTTGKPRSVVLLSGGMDSCVCAAIAARETEAAGLHVNYGQRTEAREAEAFTRICERLGIRQRLIVRDSLFRAIGGSALTDTSIGVPEVGDGAVIGQQVPVTYVPFRNAHLMAAAVSWAEVIGATRIYIGAVEQDSSGYPDCRPEFYAAFQQAIRTGTKAGDIEVVTPLIGLRKAEIVRRGVEAGAPLELTWSCYSREDKACGVCESCVLRLRAFAEAGVRDEIEYVRLKS